MITIFIVSQIMTDEKSVEHPVTGNTLEKPTQKTIEQSSHKPNPQKVEPELTMQQKLQQWLSSIAGFENSILITENEAEEYEQWLNDTGVFENLKQSDYASYDKATLYQLAGEGDIKAFEMLKLMPTYNNTHEENENLTRMGLVLGSNGAPHDLANEMWNKANTAFDNNDYDAYNRYFIDVIAFYEFAKIRGRALPAETLEKVLSSYKLEGDIEEVKKQAQSRSLDILQEINNFREQKGWSSLSTDLPAGVKRQQAALECRSNRSCVDQYIPTELQTK